MKPFVLRYVFTALIALAIGFGFLGFQYWWYKPAPKIKVVYAVYMFIGGEYATTVRASFCSSTSGGVFHFHALDQPRGWAYFSLNNLAYGLCLDEELPDPPMAF